MTGAWLALTLPLLPLVVGLLLRRRFFARFSSHARIALVSLVVLYASSAIYALPPTAASRWLAARLSSPLGEADVILATDPLLFNFSVQLAVLLLVVTSNVVLRRREIAQSSNQLDIAGAQLAREFNPSLRRYARALIAELDRYDQEVNWSDHELTPLEAEVEAERSSRRGGRIAADLVEAIRRDRTSTVFLVLGDPGSGKSVSLRRLVRLLCNQSAATGVVPVYVNLREHPAGEGISVESLVRFIKDAAFRQTGRDGRSFLETWYEPFRKSGRLFFVLDSFDELQQCSTATTAATFTRRSPPPSTGCSLRSCRPVG